MKKPSYFLKSISVFVALNVLLEIFLPTVAFALTGGPAAPEFSSFEPVATTNMVSEFSGDLTYNLPVINIPGPDGSGYAMSLSYHSGTSPEEEASWVGYGWTLNPGAINRGTRGFPDDWNSKSVTYHNKTINNMTVTAGGAVVGEAFSVDLSGNASMRYNNYKGFGYSAGVGIALAKGVVSLGFNVSDGSGSFSLAINPANALRKSGETSEEKAAIKAAYDMEVTDKTSKKAKNAAVRKAVLQMRKKVVQNGGKIPKGISNISLTGSSYGVFSHNQSPKALYNSAYSGESYNVTIGVLGTPSFLPAGVGFNTFGAYTVMENEVSSTNASFGYMYSANALNNSDMMDYYMEKLSDFNKRDKFLAIPFNNPDQFMLTGEGLGGGFRMYNRKAGHYRPNHVESQTGIFNVGGEIDAGLNFGTGGDVGVGSHSIEMENWSSQSFFQPDLSFGREASFFRFNNDMGGYVLFDEGSESLKQASLSGGGSRGSKNFNPTIGNIETALVEDGDVKRSSYIGYSTNQEMSQTAGTNNVHYRSYENDPEVYQLVNRSEAAIADQIGEVSVVNESGMRYNYGLPVYSRNEHNISYDTESRESVENNYIVYKNISNYRSKIGQERPAPYASTFLITSITTPDYIDRTYDGASEDDFGGYTSFKYRRAIGDPDEGPTTKSGARDNNWYQWRSPYRGLLFNRNELSNITDDMGSYSDGEKEVYYLEKVETKSHYALFITGTRDDGYDAHFDRATAAKSQTAKGNARLEKLVRIELYSKLDGGGGKLLKTIHFEYDPIGLCSGIPNGNGGGKLTLKKVWFEYEGIVNATISPYEFKYEYSNVTYPGSQYAYLNNYGNGLTENPPYSPFSIDAWGNYQADGPNRFENMKYWLNQGPPITGFDPAAWQLKVIKLPSGGEIHVQYEQDDYHYVQDKEANALVSLTGAVPATSGAFYLNHADLNLSAGELEQWAYKINATYANKKIYFKFLYKLLGTVSPELTHCNSEYIDGYAELSGAVYDPGAGKVYVVLKPGSYNYPIDVCRDFVTKERAGKLSTATHCDPDDGAIKGDGAEAIVSNFLTWGLSISPVGNSLKCQKMKYPLSYFKLPIYHSKKGGGIRVKRLLMYDQGLESGADVVYGNEYIYKTYDEATERYISSGVALNEPATMREENVLIQFMERFKQSFAEKVIAGRDKKQTEGPLGESIMPGAAVGYSKVVVKNIHSGRTNTGFSVKEFYTARDYPFDSQMTDIKGEPDYLPLPGGFINSFTNNYWATQGFVFRINSMHGLSKSDATWSGRYDQVFGTNLNDPILDLKKASLVSSVENYYFEPGEDIPVLEDLDDVLSNGLASGLVNKPLGKEMDLVFDSRAVKDHNDDGNVEGDIDAGIVGILLLGFITIMPTTTFSEAELYSHTTTKVIRYPAVQKSTRTFQNGMYHHTQHLAFNGATGRPLITRTFDGYDDLKLSGNTIKHDGAYTSYHIPASQKYTGMGQKAIGEKILMQNGANEIYFTKTYINGKYYITFSTSSASSGLCELLKSFAGGDLIRLSNGEIYHTGEIVGTTMEMIPVSYGTYNTTSAQYNIELIKSGRTNQLLNETGSFTVYDSELSNTYTPISSTVLNSRNTVVTTLNNWLNDNPTTPLPLSQLSGVCDKNGDPFVTTGPTSEHDYIVVENGVLKLYRPSQPNIYTTHPFVDALNNYLCEGLHQTFSGTGGLPHIPSPGTYTCPNQKTVDCPNLPLCDDIGVTEFRGWNHAKPTVVSNPTSWPPGSWLPQFQELEDWRLNQISDLNQQFTSVNNGTHSISDYYDDIDHTTPTTMLFGSTSENVGRAIILKDVDNNDTWTNKRVMLKHKSSGALHGMWPAIHYEMHTFNCTHDPGGNTCSSGQCSVSANHFISGNDGIITDIPILRGAMHCPSAGQTPDYDFNLPPVGLIQDMLPYDLYDDPSYNYPDNCTTDLLDFLGDTYFSITNDGYLKVEPSGSVFSGCTNDYIFYNIRFYDLDAICSMDLFPIGDAGQFKLNERNGNLEYLPFGAPCSPVNVTCLQFCDQYYGIDGISNVVACNASLYDYTWPYNEDLYYPANVANANDYEKGFKGKYRQLANFIYRSSISGVNSTTPNMKTYNSGLYTMEVFDWRNLAANKTELWQELTTTTQYSPNGNMLEEKNILDIYSTAKYGYDKHLPYLIAANCDYNSVLFESFEKTYESGTLLEDGMKATLVTASCSTSVVTGCSVSNAAAHSGNHCYECPSTTSVPFDFFWEDFPVTTQMVNDGVNVKAWVKYTHEVGLDPAEFYAVIHCSTGDIQFEEIGRSGDWILIEADIPDLGSYAPNENLGLVLYCIPQNNDPVYIDDIRFQPRSAQVTCYVYDINTYRLLTSFDDQHFGLFYQYNSEGQLTRKIKETERGIKTVTETQYNIPLTNR